MFHQPFRRWSKVCQWDASPSPRFPRCACTKSSPPLKLVVYDVKIGKVHDYLTTWTLWQGIEHWDLWLGPHLLTLENGNIAFHISGLSPPLPLVASDQFFHHQSSWSHRPTRQAASETFQNADRNNFKILMILFYSTIRLSQVVIITTVQAVRSVGSS